MNTRILIRSGSVLFGVLSCFLLLTVAVAAPNIIEKGTFQNIESKDPVLRIVITKGEHIGVYRLSPMAQIYDGYGKRTTIDTYMMPSEVEFVVEYTERGPIIKKIREMPQ